VLLDSTKLIPTDAFKLGDIILTKGCRGGKEVDVFTVIRYQVLNLPQKCDSEEGCIWRHRI
jgi:hypothetical protein